MERETITQLAEQIAGKIKTETDLNDFSRILKKITVETALNAELAEHLGYEKHRVTANRNSRNGNSSKRLITETGPVEVEIPRDREGNFDPQLVKKHQRRLTLMDDKILCLYAKGMTTREIVTTFKEMYDADVSATLISKVTEAVIDQVKEWQTRPLDAVYPIVYLDCIIIKVRQDNQVINKSVDLVLGVNLEGRKELLGMDIGNRRSEVLVRDNDPAAKSWGKRYTDCLC